MSNSSNSKSLHPRGHGSGTPVKKAPVRGPTPTRPAPALPRTARGKSGVARPVPPVATFPSRTVPDLRHTRPSATYATKVARTVTTGNIAQPASKRQGLIAASKHVRTASLPVASKAPTAANKLTRSPRPTSLPEVGKENTVPSFARPTRTSSARVQPAVERASVKLTLRPSRPLQSPTKSTRPPFKRVSNDKPLPVTPPAASARSFSISRSGDDASTLSIGEEPKQATPHNKQVPDEIVPPPVPEKDGVPLHVLVEEMLAGKATAAIPWPLYEMPTTPPTTPSCPEHPAPEISLPAALSPAETIIPETIPSPVSPSVQPTVPETNQESDDEKADPPAIVITRPTSAPLEQFITPDGIVPITTELSKNDLLSPDCEPKVLASRRTIDFKLPSAAELLKKRSAAKAKRLETAQRQRPSKKFTAQLDLLEEEYEDLEDTSTMQTIVQQEDSTSPSATIHHPEQEIRSFFEDDEDFAKSSDDDYDGLLPELIDDLIGTDSEEELTAIDGRFATCLENLDNADIDFPNLSRAINTRILTADSEDNYWSVGHRELLHALGSLSACVQDIEDVLNDDITCRFSAGCAQKMEDLVPEVENDREISIIHREKLSTVYHPTVHQMDTNIGDYEKTKPALQRPSHDTPEHHANTSLCNIRLVQPQLHENLGDFGQSDARNTIADDWMDINTDALTRVKRDDSRTIQRPYTFSIGDQHMKHEQLVATPSVTTLSHNLGFWDRLFQRRTDSTPSASIISTSPSIKSTRSSRDSGAFDYLLALFRTTRS